jgi:hypothetical protein
MCYTKSVRKRETHRKRGHTMARITIEAIKALKNNDGLTLKRFISISYKSGWQVATEGKET